METQAGRPEPSGFRSKRPRKAAQWLNPLLRFLQLAAAVCAFPVMIRAGAGLLWFSNWHAFSFLIAGTVIAGFWALLMLLLDCFLAATGKMLHSTALLWAIVIGDFIALSMALSAGAATAAITTLNDQGLPGRPFICTGSTPFNTFCARTKAAAAMALISAAFFLPSLLLSGARLASEFYEEDD
ncbi:hypothetical protein CLOM_g2883 [Closterium sp. NIES-68]|nr:hypothetical protein CLOM_g2883 [Closterium sp. NIES-68]GJP69464.1 hypothetical protein CLOP_g477 [Closterium sp. NIES-67]GJP75747.1 hypothetical protein CLOP_g6153 [Closterium sp. NIES-67]